MAPTVSVVQVVPTNAVAETLKNRLLFDRDDPQWQEVRRAYHDEVLPERLLTDGDTLWIGFEYLGDWNDPFVGLIALDWKSGRVESLRMGQKAPGKMQLQDRVYGEHERLANLCRWQDWICMGQPGAGVMLFPAHPESGDRTLDRVIYLSTTNGLIDPYITALAGVGDDLYIAAGAVLMRWNRITRQTALVADARREAGDPLSGKEEIAALLPSEDGKTLYVLAGPFRTYARHTMDILNFNPKTGVWRPVGTRSQFKYKGGHSIVSQPGDGTVLLANPRPALVKSAPKPRWYFRFHAPTERIDLFDATNQPALTFMEDTCRDWDLAATPQGTICLTIPPRDPTPSKETGRLEMMPREKWKIRLYTKP